MTSPRGTTTAGMLPKLAAAALRSCRPPASRRSPTRKSLFGATCGSCHSFTTKTAPTLAEIHDLYATDSAKVVEWAKAPMRKRMKFEPMPSFAHLGEARLKALAGYMLQQAAAGPPPQ